MATINDFGGPTDTLATPSLSEWAAAVAYRLSHDVWQTWTPTSTGFTASAVDARYARSAGGVIYINAAFTITAVTGSCSFTLPAAALKDANGAAMLTAGGASYLGSVRAITGQGSGYFDAYTASGNYVGRANLGPTVPGTWTSGDKITCSLIYQCDPLP